VDGGRRAGSFRPARRRFSAPRDLDVSGGSRYRSQSINAAGSACARWMYAYCSRCTSAANGASHRVRGRRQASGWCRRFHRGASVPERLSALRHDPRRRSRTPRPGAKNRAGSRNDPAGSPRKRISTFRRAIRPETGKTHETAECVSNVWITVRLSKHCRSFCRARTADGPPKQEVSTQFLSRLAITVVTCC